MRLLNIVDAEEPDKAENSSSLNYHYGVVHLTCRLGLNCFPGLVITLSMQAEFEKHLRVPICTTNKQLDEAICTQLLTGETTI